MHCKMNHSQTHKMNRNVVQNLVQNLLSIYGPPETSFMWMYLIPNSEDIHTQRETGGEGIMSGLTTQCSLWLLWVKNDSGQRSAK